MTQLSMLDLFAGTGSASAAMRERGWRVVRVELDRSHRPDVVGDVAHLPIRGQFELIWASPPCTEYSRWSMPWLPKVAPDKTLWEASLDAIARLRPRWWVIENVRGASSWWGPPVRTYGPIFLWGDFPDFHADVPFFKERLAGKDRVKRAATPYAVSRALALACEREAALLPMVGACQGRTA